MLLAEPGIQYSLRLMLLEPPYPGIGYLLLRVQIAILFKAGAQRGTSARRYHRTLLLGPAKVTLFGFGCFWH